MLRIDITENLVHEVSSTDPTDIGRQVEVRDYDWPRMGDLDEIPNGCEYVEENDEEYVRSYTTIKDAKA